MSVPNSTQQPDPSRIMQIGMGFWASKLLLVAIKFELFTLLASQKSGAGAIKEKLGLRTTDQHVFDFLDGLVSLGFLEREGILEKAIYSNSPDSNIFLDKKKPSYSGGILEMANNRLYEFWGHLEQGLLTGEAQNETKGAGNMNFFEDLYKSPEKLREFMNAMSAIQAGNFISLVRQFPFSNYSSLVDVGGADASFSIQVAAKHPRMHCISFDLPAVEPLAKAKIRQAGLEDRISFSGGDFFKDPIPRGEVISMGNILHGCNEEIKLQLIQRVFEALPGNGVFIAIENIIDDERRKNTFGMLMSLNMLIENGDGFDYTFRQFESWVKKAGFKKAEIIPLTGPTSAAIAYK